MAAKGNNWYDVLKWVEKVIESCETRGQAKTARKLVKSYFKRYERELGELDLEVFNGLIEKLDGITFKKI